MKLLSEEQRKELNSILGDGHTIYTTDKVKRICESIDVPFPDDIVESYWTRYWQCSKHGLNVGKIHHLDKDWTREELEGKWAGGYLLLQRSSGMDIVESIAIVRCCKNGQYLWKHKIEMWDEDGSIDLYKRYNCISGIDFNSWLGSYLKPSEYIKVDKWKTPPEGRGYRSRWYSEGVMELLEERGYLEKTVSS